MINKCFAFLACLFFTTILSAQQDLGTAFLYNAWQTNYTNPAKTPKNFKVAISLPGMYGNTSLPLSINNLITPTATGNLLDIEKGINQLKNRNNILVNAHVHSFNLAIAFGKLSFNIGHAVRSDFALRFPKELAQVAWQGNAPFIGETLEIAPNISFNLYNEYSFGGTYNLDKLTVGGKVKVLAGIGTLSSKNSSIELLSENDIYQLSFNGDYTVRTAGMIEFDAEDGIIVNSDLMQSNAAFSKNLGVAFDFGATYQFSEKLSFSASILDIGGIRWQDIPNVYKAEGNARFEGINLIDYAEDFSLSFDEKKDSILALFNVSQESETFTSSLPTRIYLGANYEFNQWFTFGGLVYFEDYQRNVNAALAVNATLHLGKIWDIGASYAIKPNSASNIGLSSVLSLGPVQFFAMTDNILAVITPETQRNANFRTGLNLVFKDKNREKATKEKKGKKNEYYKNAPPIDCPSGKKKRKLKV